MWGCIQFEPSLKKGLVQDQFESKRVSVRYDRDWRTKTQNNLTLDLIQTDSNLNVWIASNSAHLWK